MAWLACASAAIGVEPDEVVDRVAVWRNVRYRANGSASCTLDLAALDDRRAAPRPAILVIHGGGWLEGDKSSFTTSEHRIPGNIFDFAERGFVAAAINYRLSGEAVYPAALEDCQAAVAWLREHADQYAVDPRRIGAYGNSAGGHLALMLALTDAPASDSGQAADGNGAARVQAAASDSGPLDLVYGYEHKQVHVAIERFLGGPPVGDRLAAYRRASPSSYVGDGLPPLLLIYGAQDEQVGVGTADDFVAALGRARGNDVDYHRLARAGHCPHSMVRVPYLNDAVLDFFARALQLDAGGASR